MAWRARVVLPEDSLPKTSMTRPRGYPPTPRARSRPTEPLGTTATGATSPSRPSCMIAPFPNCFSMAATAAATAFSFSLTLPTPRLPRRMFRGPGARGRPRAVRGHAGGDRPSVRSAAPVRLDGGGPSAGGAFPQGWVGRGLEAVGAGERGVERHHGVARPLDQLVALLHRQAGGGNGRADRHPDDAGTEGPQVRRHAPH